MKIYYVRHGQTDLNLAKKMQGGGTEKELNETGVSQAYNTKKELENVKYLFDTAVIALTSTYFTYRVALNETLTYPINLTLNSIIGQLRGLYATYSDGGVNNA